MTLPIDAVRIRRIEADQGLILRDLRIRSLLDAPLAFGQSVDEASALADRDWHRSARQAAQGDGRAWLLASRGEEHIGLVQGRRRRPATLLLFSMWVDPGARGVGVGRSLVDHLERWAAAWGAEETRLWVVGRNAPAVAFYGRLGFSVIDSGPDAASGARFAALAMRRDIARPSS